METWEACFSSIPGVTFLSSFLLVLLLVGFYDFFDINCNGIDSAVFVMTYEHNLWTTSLRLSQSFALIIALSSCESAELFWVSLSIRYDALYSSHSICSFFIFSKSTCHLTSQLITIKNYCANNIIFFSTRRTVLTRKKN